MTHLLSSVRLFNGDSYEEQLIALSLDDIDKLKNWDCNRLPDENKVNEIIQSIVNYSYSNQIIHAFVQDDKYIVYDGGHRITAIHKMLNDTTQCAQVKSYFQDKILISVLLCAPIEYIIERFRAINQVTPVPEFYKEPLQQSTSQLRSLIPESIKLFKKVYKCAKTSQKPHLPSYNPFHLENELFDLLNYNNDISDSTILTSELVLEVFAVINTKYRLELLKEPTLIKNGITCVNKAESVNCFIFLKRWQDDFVPILNRIVNIIGEPIIE